MKSKAGNIGAEDIPDKEIEKMIWGKNVPAGFKYSKKQEEEEIRKDWIRIGKTRRLT
jgi:hypothetical protein